MEDMDIDEVTAALHRSEDEDEQFEGEGEGDEDEEDEGEDYETKYYAEDPDDGKAELDEKGRIRDRKGADEGEEEEEGERVEGEEDDEEDDAGPSELIIDNDPETRRTELPAVTQTIAITEPLASSSDAVDRPLEARHSTTGVYIPPFEPTGQYVTYRCAMYDCDNPANLDKEQARAYACGNVQRCRRGESLRCRMCGGNIMEKVRTERMVQFQAI
jgi:DNA-directed RNA polymerase subunit RPC12/RpoP